MDLDEWIDVYDGEGWHKRMKGDEKEVEREQQGAASYFLAGFEDSLVLDERNLHYLQQEVAKLLEHKAGGKM